MASIDPWLAQIVLALPNGAFYAILSLGLAVIFGMLNIINFAHGALCTLGAFAAWLLLTFEINGQPLGIGYYPALVLAPLIVGMIGLVLEKALIQWVYKLDHLYGLLLTFGIALVIEGLLRYQYNSSGHPYAPPPSLRGVIPLGFMYLPIYRAWVVGIALAVCLAVWLLIEKTPIGALLRASTENPSIVRSFGVNVPLLITLTFAGGVALAAFAGVLAAPIYNVSPQLGAGFITKVFAVVVIGGMGSIGGAVFTGFLVGMIEGITKNVYSDGSEAVVYLVMVIVLLVRPAGLFGKAT